METNILNNIDNQKKGRLAFVLLTIGIIAFVLMIYTSIVAFAQVGTGDPDTNVVNVDPNLASSQSLNDGNISTGVDVTVFSAEYEKDGKITVQSDNGENVVAPGTSDTGKFTVKNTSNFKIKCTCDFFGENQENVPVYVKLQDNTGAYILGSANKYADTVALNGISKTYEMEPGQVVNFELPWEWLFETKNASGDITTGDMIDTDFGNRAVDKDIIVKVGVKTTAEIIPGPEPTPEPIKPSKTGDYLPWILAGLAIIFVVAAIVVWRSSKKAKAKKQEGKDV